MKPQNLPKNWLTPDPKPRRKNRSRPARLLLEMLESRITPSVLPAPDPIDPTRGESNLLRVVQMHADKQNLNAQDHSPVPYTIIVSAGGAAPTVKNWHAGAPTRLDADQSKTTGQGGNDIQVEVNTDLYTNSLGQPDWRLRLNVNQIGSAPFAQNLSVVISFPFDAFNSESLPGAPNLMMGFQSRLPGTPGQASYVTGLDGGNAPATMQMVLTPHVLAGTNHTFEWSIDTTGATNPLTFLAGEFDGNPGSNSVVDALGWSAYVQNVPAHIGTELTVAENALGSPAVDSKMDLHWTASGQSLTTFDYMEAETTGAAASPQAANFVTEVVADKMPTDEHFVLRQDEAGGTLTLNQDANAPIHEMTFLKRRSDGLALTGVASDDNPAADAVPTHVALTLGLRGYENLDVNANTLDLYLQDTQDRGFSNTGQFFEKYNLEYVGLRVKNAPDQSANYDGATKTFTAAATNAGESMPFTEMVLDDNGRIDATNAPLNLDLSDNYGVLPPWNLWSIVDDGTHGTAVARALDAKTASFNHFYPDIKETVDLRTVVQHPMQIYLKSGLLSAVQPPVPAGATSPDPYIEVTGHIEDVPVGHTTVTLDFPLTATWHSESKIGEICMAGHIGTLNFALILQDNPTNGSFDFRPEGSLVVKALNDINNTPGNDLDDLPDFFTANAAIVYDVTGFDPNVVPWPENYSLNGFHSVHDTFFPNGKRLEEARLRLDHVPSLRATWDNETQHTYVDVDTDATSGPFAYVGGVQVQISTKTTLAGTTLTCDNALSFLPPAATPQSEHYALLKDVAGEQTLKFGIFGVDSFHFASDDTSSPSKYKLDWALDPSRPYTAAHITVDTHSAASGALGAFFGGNTVTGPLDVGYIPPDFHISSDFEPTISTQTFFPGGLPIPNVISQQFTVNGTQIFVYAQQIPKFFSVTWNIANPTTTLAVTAQDNLGNPDRAQLVEVLFLNPNGLPGGTSLFANPTNPLKELRVRLDDVPSLTSSWTTTGATNINVQTINAAPFDVLGGLRLNTSTVAGSTALPTFPNPTGTENHYVNLQDTGSVKQLGFGLFGVRQFSYTDPGWIHTVYNGNVNRKFVATINSNNGRFFPGHVLQAAFVVNTLPGVIDLLAAADGSDLSYRASSGIGSIQIGGLTLAGMTGNAYATYDTRRAELTLTGLPGQFGYDLADGSQFGLSAAAKITNLTAWLRDSSTGGLDHGAGILGPAMHDLRLRVDGVPSFTGDSTSLTSVPYTANNAGVRPVAGNVLYDTVTGATAVVTAVDGANGGLFDGGQAKVRLDRTAAFVDGDSLDVLDALPFNGQTGLFSVGDVITGKTSGATAVVRRVDQLAAAGTLDVNGVSGTFQNGEKLLVNGQVMALATGALQVTPDWVAARVAGNPKKLESQMDFGTSVPGVSLTGVQLGLSSRFEDPDNPAFTVAQPPTYFLNLFDQNVPSVGEVARLQAGLSSIQQIGYASVDQGAKAPLNRFHLIADTARRLDVGLDTEFGSKLTSQGMRGSVTVQDVPAQWDLTTDLKKTIDHKGSSVVSHIDADILMDDSGDGFNAPFKGHHVVAHIVDVPTVFNADLGIGDTSATAQAPVTKQHKHVHANGPVTSIYFEDTKDLISSTGRPSWTLLQVTGLPGSFDYDVEKDYSVDDKKNLTLTNSSTTVFVKDPGGSPASLPFFRMVSSNFESKAVTLAKDLARFTNIAGGLVQQSDFAKAVDDRYWPAGVQDRLNDIYGSSFHLDTDPLNPDPTYLLADHFLQQSFGEATIPGVEVKLSGNSTATTTTDANGNYVFGGLSDGTYQVTETQPAGATDGPVNVGSLGGTAGTNTVSNIVVGTGKDKDGNDVIQSGFGYNFGELSLPNPGLPPGPAQPSAAQPGSLSGHAYWDENGDGVYNATDLVDYTDIQMHGFQSAEEIEDKGAKNTHVELQVPSTGSHPFFVGSETERNKVTIARIDNLPSSVTLDYTEKDHLDFTAASSAGRVDIYQGPLPAAGDDDTAIRAILLDTPTSVHIGYGFGFPNGGIDFTASSAFELRLLDQDGGQRIVAGLQMQELRVGYGLSGLFLGGGFGDNVADTTLGVDDAWWLLKYGAGIANNTDGTGIQGSESKAPVNGFFGLYERRDDIHDLNPAGPAHGPKEYVPRVTAMLKDFQEFSAAIGLAIDPLDMLDDVASIYPIDLAVQPPKLTGTLDFDVWFNADTDETVSLPVVGDVGFINHPDYSDNTPFMIFPMTTTFGRLGIDHDAVITFDGFHYPSDEIDPFPLPPMLAAAPATTVSTGPLLTNNLLQPLWQEAAQRWAESGATPEQVRRALATTPTVTDLPGLYLGATVEGRVYIDANAARYGWYIDPTPGADEEFGATGNGAAAGRMDLLTVLSHEMGRLFGYDITDAAMYSSMAPTLSPGVRLGDGAAEIPETTLSAKFDLEEPIASEHKSPNLLLDDRFDKTSFIAPTIPREQPMWTNAAWTSFGGGWGLASSTKSVEATPASLVGLFDRSARIVPGVPETEVVTDVPVGRSGRVGVFQLRPVDQLGMDDFDPVYVD